MSGPNGKGRVQTSPVSALLADKPLAQKTLCSELPSQPAPKLPINSFRQSKSSHWSILSLDCSGYDLSIFHFAPFPRRPSSFIENAAEAPSQWLPRSLTAISTYWYRRSITPLDQLHRRRHRLWLLSDHQEIYAWTMCPSRGRNGCRA